MTSIDLCTEIHGQFHYKLQENLIMDIWLFLFLEGEG